MLSLDADRRRPPPPTMAFGAAMASRRVGAQCVNLKKDVGHPDLYKERDVAHQMRI